MSFLNTEPVPILAQDDGIAWRSFLVGAPISHRWLHKISQGDVPVSLGRSPSALLSATLWAVDEAASMLHFSAPDTAANTLALSDLVSHSENWAAAYVGDDKIQFKVRQLGVVVKDGRLQISGEGPVVLYRLTRRKGLRVRRPPSQAPVARVASTALLSSRSHEPAASEALASCDQTHLLVANLSLQGCALRLPTALAAPRPGQLLRQVEVELDEDTLLYADLVVHHVTPDFRENSSVLVGCLWGHMSASARLLLEKWILSGRRRLELVSLNFD